MKKLKVLDLFAGTRSISKAFEAAGHEAFSIELDERHKDISWHTDILNVTPEDILERFGQPDVIWASPMCTTYSIAAISHHRTREENGNLLPKSADAFVGDDLIKHTIYLIQRLRPKYWYIENPRGGMRKMDFMFMLPRHTVTYCAYGDDRMKPTDLWTNHPNPQFKPMCKNGDGCHEAAPRGSKTGTQGRKGSVERSMIPQGLCEHIVKISEMKVK
ncbi:DNA cytosine methyltransferase [Priestia megaterium]